MKEEKTELLKVTEITVNKKIYNISINMYDILYNTHNSELCKCFKHSINILFLLKIKKNEIIDFLINYLYDKKIEDTSLNNYLLVNFKYFCFEPLSPNSINLYINDKKISFLKSEILSYQEQFIKHGYINKDIQKYKSIIDKFNYLIRRANLKNYISEHNNLKKSVMFESIQTLQNALYIYTL